MTFEGQQLQTRKKEKSLSRQFEFKPKVNETSKDIALRYREKVEQQN